MRWSNDRRHRFPRDGPTRNMAECTYCGSDLAQYDPVFVERETDGERVSEGQFCNYACLSAHVDDNGLTGGAACAWDP